MFFCKRSMVNYDQYYLVEESYQTPEQRYSSTDKELLSIYFAFKKCEFYFVVYTDHKPLILLKTFKALVDKRIRSINYQENINTVIRYIIGTEKVVSDFISRTIKK